MFSIVHFSGWMPFLMAADKAARLIVTALNQKKKVYNFPWQMGLLMRATRWLPDWVIARAMRRHSKNPPKAQPGIM